MCGSGTVCSPATTAVVGSGPVLGHSGHSSTSSGGTALLAPSPTSTSPGKLELPAAPNLAPFVAGSVGSGEGLLGQLSTADSMEYTMSEAMNYVVPAVASPTVAAYAMR